MPLFLAGTWKNCQSHFNAEQELVADGQVKLSQQDEDCQQVTKIAAGKRFISGPEPAESAIFLLGDIMRPSETDAECSLRPVDRPPTKAEAGAFRDIAAKTLPPPRRAGFWSRPFILSGSAGVIAFMLLIVGCDAHDREAADKPIVPAAEASVTPALENASPPTQASLNTSDAARATREEPPTHEQSAPAEPPADKWNGILGDLRDAILLMLVEQPGTGASWPFATACAIREDTLLTSGTAGKELARFQERGWKVWAVSPSSGQRHAVEDVRVHVGFDDSEGSPDQQIYVDLALLTLGDQSSSCADLATTDDIDALERGQPVGVLGIAHNSEPVSRFSAFAVELWRGGIFVTTSLPPSPGGPRLLHVRAELPGKPYGSPVVNEAGRVIGVYAETAETPAGREKASLKLNYAPVVDSRAIKRWLDGQDSEWWVPPDVPRAPSPAIAPFNAEEAAKRQQVWGQFLGEPVVETNSIGMELALLPPGEFEMGSTPDVIARHPAAKGKGYDEGLKRRDASELPRHHVKLTRPFRLSRLPTTVGQFRRFVTATNYKTEAESGGLGGYDVTDWKRRPGVNWQTQPAAPPGLLADNMPVVNVTWNDAQAFCRWLSEQEGKAYRLPTEAEWEYACRAGTTTVWSFGDDESKLAEYAWLASDGVWLAFLRPSDGKPPNPFGLYGMHSQLWELCQDRFSFEYYGQSPIEDPMGPVGNEQADYVMRGGRSACRGLRPPSSPGLNIGFRVACDVAYLPVRKLD